jgi:hypothetical protein
VEKRNTEQNTAAADIVTSNLVGIVLSLSVRRAIDHIAYAKGDYPIFPRAIEWVLSIHGYLLPRG